MRQAITVVTLQTDYYMSWPLWFYDTIQDQADLAPISEELKARLRNWAVFYDEHFSEHLRWDGPESESEYVSTGRALHRDLQQELGNDYRVELKL